MEPHELFNDKLSELIEQAAKHDLQDDATATVMKNLKTFSECRPPAPDPEATPEPVPTTSWEKFKAGAAQVWDNETTRTLIKAGGALSGVVLVTWTTIYKDHVIERQAISQANQRNS